MAPAPVRTSNVASPPLFPNCMSVLSLSPTMIVRLGSKLTLQSTRTHANTHEKKRGINQHLPNDTPQAA